MGILGEIGTLEWARRTNGILGRGERARFVAAVIWETGKGAPRVIASRARRGGGGGPDPSRLTPPDSAAARETVEEVAGALPETVVEHSYRSYIYARALAIAEGIECDEEATFVAAMFHDYGVKGIDDLDDRCFTLPGSEGAAAVADRAGWPASRRDAAAEAITMHLNPSVPVEHGTVQHLVHEGVILDVVGLRAGELDPAGIRRVRERHPRLRFNQVGGAILRDHGRRVAGCRAAALFATGFGLSLKLGPWQD